MADERKDQDGIGVGPSEAVGMLATGMGLDLEIYAMERMIHLLDPLDSDTRRRVLEWALRRFVDSRRLG